MASCKILITSIFLCLFLNRIGCSAGSPSRPDQEIEQLKSKIASLELSYLDLEEEVKRKVEVALKLEDAIREKSARVASLVGEIDALQMVKVDEEESMMKANTRNFALEKQIEKLLNELKAQMKKGEALEVRASRAEKSAQELSRKLESVENINSEQIRRVQEIDHNLQQTKSCLK